MQYLRRFLWFVAKRLLGLTMLVGVLIIAFYMAMNTSNITILLKDGMALRAQVIMMGEDESRLMKYFQQDFVALDTALNLGLSSDSPYENYNITAIDHRLNLQWMWCWPWDDTARADFIESIPKIDGRIKSGLRAEAEATDPSSIYPPAWNAAKYRATLERENGRWKIAAIQLLEMVESP